MEKEINLKGQKKQPLFTPKKIKITPENENEYEQVCTSTNSRGVKTFEFRKKGEIKLN